MHTGVDLHLYKIASAPVLPASRERRDLLLYDIMVRSAQAPSAKPGAGHPG